MKHLYVSTEGLPAGKTKGGKNPNPTQKPRPSAFHRMPDVANRVRMLQPWPWIRGTDCWPALQLGWTQMAGLPCVPGAGDEVKAEDDVQVAVELKAALSGTPHLCGCRKEGIFERKSPPSLQMCMYPYAPTSRICCFFFEDQRMTCQ